MSRDEVYLREIPPPYTQHIPNLGPRQIRFFVVVDESGVPLQYKGDAMGRRDAVGMARVTKGRVFELTYQLSEVVEVHL